MRISAFIYNKKDLQIFSRVQQMTLKCIIKKGRTAIPRVATIEDLGV
jgi:hypothetical protein